mmetsp:Transcript_2517/g.8952  ORF Transcript_2517/g.8952 Transcript_2517/m.8952 type:complete len:245 (+) Transcript_2517:1-735(+)
MEPAPLPADESRPSKRMREGSASPAPTHGSEEIWQLVRSWRRAAHSRWRSSVYAAMGPQCLSAGYNHVVSLRPNGSIQCMGANLDGQAPPGGIGGQYLAVSAGTHHSLAVRKGDLAVVCWGSDHHNQTPSGGVDGRFITVSAGSHHSLALREDGSVQCWGSNDCGQAPPWAVEAHFAAVSVVAVSAGGWHSLGLRADGSVVRWGSNEHGQAAPARVARLMTHGSRSSRRVREQAQGRRRVGQEV